MHIQAGFGVSYSEQLGYCTKREQSRDDNPFIVSINANLTVRPRRSQARDLPRNINFQNLYVQDHISHIQSLEWNSTTVSKESGQKVYTSDNNSIGVLFNLDDTKAI